MRRLSQRGEGYGPDQDRSAAVGVVGRDIARIEGFDYSDALRGKDGQWTFDNLYEFIHGPKEWAPGTKMAFAGIKGPEDRADLLVYLRTLADQPVPLPKQRPNGQLRSRRNRPRLRPSRSAKASAGQD